jgi:hypothetical protein
VPFLMIALFRLPVVTKCSHCDTRLLRQLSSRLDLALLFKCEISSFLYVLEAFTFGLVFTLPLSRSLSVFSGAAFVAASFFRMPSTPGAYSQENKVIMPEADDVFVVRTKFEARLSELEVPNTNLGSFRPRSTNVELKKNPLCSPIPWMTCLEIDWHSCLFE